MKKFCSLFIASLIVVSLMGQEVQRRIPVSDDLRGIEDFQGKSAIGLEKEDYLTVSQAKSTVIDQSGQINQQRMDSVIYEFLDSNLGELIISRKELYTYNTNGNTKQCLQYWRGSNTDPFHIQKTEYAYDAIGNPTSMAYYTWNSVTSLWVGEYKMEATWNINRRETQILYYSLDHMTNEWVYENKREFTYDSKANQIKYTFYHWNKNSSLWMVVYSEDMNYDSNGHLTEEIKNNTDEVSGKLTRIQSNYNLSGQEIQIINYSWNEALQSWDIASKMESLVNAEGKVIETIESYIDVTSGLPVASGKTDYSYDSQGTMVLGMIYSAYLGQWVLSSKVETNYNSEERFIQRMNYTWDVQTNQLQYGFKTESFYDINYNETESIDYTINNETSQWVMNSYDKTTFDLNRNRLQSIHFNKDCNYSGHLFFSKTVLNKNRLFYS